MAATRAAWTRESCPTAPRHRPTWVPHARATCRGSGRRKPASPRRGGCGEGWCGSSSAGSHRLFPIRKDVLHHPEFPVDAAGGEHDPTATGINSQLRNSFGADPDGVGCTAIERDAPDGVWRVGVLARANGKDESTVGAPSEWRVALR